MSELPEPTFRKTKTEKWAVMAPVATLEAALAGDGKVEVLKKSGDRSSFTVGSLGKPFEVDGIEMCYGYAPGDEDTGGRSSDERSSTAVSGTAGSRPAASSSGPAPSRDTSEPLPEFQGDDHWGDEF